MEENGAKWGVPLAVDLTPEELARRRAAQMKRLLKLYRCVRPCVPTFSILSTECCR